MSKQIFYIDPLEKLVTKKDSSLLLAHEMKARGKDVYILFKSDLFICSSSADVTINCHTFISSRADDFYLKSFELLKKVDVTITAQDTIHMRLEPPFDLTYMRSLWLLNFIKDQTNCNVINDPLGIMKNNEKVTSFLAKSHIDTFVGQAVGPFMTFVQKLRDHGEQNLILKPLDLFQGIGVQKVSLDQSNEELMDLFQRYSQEHDGQVVAQPFLKEVSSGEIRAIFYDRKLIGAIKKIPTEGSYLANIAQGATFSKTKLSQEELESCHHVCDILGEKVPWVAFDIIGGRISEVNITCPGLLVEVSKAMNLNLAAEIESLV